MNSQFKTSLIAFFAGLLMSFGLALAKMTDAHVVVGFLDIFGNWNPSLLLVMIGAILFYAIFFRIIKKRKKPLWAPKFILPLKHSIDKRLIGGAALFGLGWGITGICPAPALVNLASGNQDIIIFVISMIIGMKLFQFLDNKI